MKRVWHETEFCGDVTRDIVSDEELSRLCTRTASTAGRRQMVRKIKSALAVAFIAAAAWFVLNPRKTEIADVRVQPQPSQPELAYILIRTEPFTNVIATKPLGGEAFFPGIEPTTAFRTPRELAYKEISDDELLRLLEGRTIALVRGPSGRLELLDGDVR